jgi:small GTP-binding protein
VSLNVVVLVGDPSVGKTCFMVRYTKNLIPRTTDPTIGVEYATKNMLLKNEHMVKLQLWDTAGSERYRSITTIHYRNAHGAILFFDLTCPQSFNNLEIWLKDK